MGWLYMRSLKGYETPTEYLDNQFTYEGEERSYRVLRSALVKMRRYYAAVEYVDADSGSRSIFAVVCLVNCNRRARDGYIFGYRDMDEMMGPGEYDCPGAILDLLTPTDSEWAKDWRQKCRARLAKLKPQVGQIIVLAKPIKFSDGSVLSRFSVVERTVRNRKKLLFRSEGGGFYRLGNLRDLEYTIETAVSSLPTSEAVTEQTSLFA